MSKDELLILRKTLIDLLDKRFIRVSNSLIITPVLFIKKLKRGLRFYIDYKGLNRVIKKDRYPLLFIYETLQNINKAKQFTKLNVIATFYKLRIFKKDEQKTVFRTRYSLYKQIIIPFSLINILNTFQKYVNQALKDYLNEFYSVYINDILIYSSGNR